MNATAAGVCVLKLISLDAALVRTGLLYCWYNAIVLVLSNLQRVSPCNCARAGPHNPTEEVAAPSHSCG